MVFSWKKRGILVRTIRHCFNLWDESFQGKRKREVYAFMLYLGFISTLFCFVLWTYLYSQFTVEQLMALPNSCVLCFFFTMHCSLYNVCNNHIDSQSDTVPNNCLKQSKTKSTMLIAFCSYLLIVLFCFFFFKLFKFIGKCPFKCYLLDCVLFWNWGIHRHHQRQVPGTWYMRFRVPCLFVFQKIGDFMIAVVNPKPWS